MSDDLVSPFAQGLHFHQCPLCGRTHSCVLLGCATAEDPGFDLLCDYCL